MYDVFIGTLYITMGQHFFAWMKSLEILRQYGRITHHTSHQGKYGTRIPIVTHYFSRTHQFISPPNLKFVTDWLDYIRRYESLVWIKSCFQMWLKKVMLRNSLQGHEVIVIATQLEKYNMARGNGSLDYDAYTDVVQNLQPNLIDRSMLPHIWPSRIIMLIMVKNIMVDQMMMMMGILDPSLFIQHL